MFDASTFSQNLVGMMLESADYEVVDLGVNATSDEILENAPGAVETAHRLVGVGAEPDAAVTGVT